jgi:hypothetical protein
MELVDHPRLDLVDKGFNILNNNFHHIINKYSKKRKGDIEHSICEEGLIRIVNNVNPWCLF